jgi:hypothetical protein
MIWIWIILTGIYTIDPSDLDLAKIDITSTSNIYQDLSKVVRCQCDIQENACDYMCCCDPDCSET